MSSPNRPNGIVKWSSSDIYDGAVAAIGEAVIVLEAGEASGDHAVAEEDRRLVALDHALVKLGQTELQAPPSHHVSRIHEA